jgi:hypothetical protein
MKIIPVALTLTASFLVILAAGIFTQIIIRKKLVIRNY